MKKFRLFEVLVLIVLMLACTYGLIQLDKGRITARLDPAVAQAAVDIPSPASPGYMMTVLPITGSYTTMSSTTKVRFVSEWPATLLGFQAICRTTGGGAMTADITVDGTSYLTTPLSFKATTEAKGVLAYTAIPAGAVIRINLVSTGNTWTDPTVNIYWKRK